MSWQRELEAAIARPHGTIVGVEPVGGGDINDAYRVVLSSKLHVFVKTHRAPPAGLFEAEAAGLAWLAEGPLRVPRVIAVGPRFLCLEWLELGARGGSIDEALGRGLAGLHALGAPSFGLDRANFLATLPQDNTAEPDIVRFWIERRLRPLVERMRAPALHARLDALAARPDRFGPPERPARLHGDLWWGNVGAQGATPVIFDPAVYGGHREIDLAMLALFGGVSDRLVRAYDEVWPLADGWRARVPLWQLYPLAAHAVLFGGGYGAQVARILDALT